MPVRGVTPILNVSDIEASFRWFQAFGWEISFAWNEGGLIEPISPANEHGPAVFGGVRSNEQSIFLCVGSQGSRGTRGPKFPGDDATDGVWMSWWVNSVEEVDEFHEIAKSIQAEISLPPEDQPWGVREFHLRHPDGHTFRVGCGLSWTPQPSDNE